MSALAQPARPSERELALTSNARHKAFLRKLEDKAAELERKRDHCASKAVEIRLAIMESENERRLKALDTALATPPAPGSAFFLIVNDDDGYPAIRQIQRAVCTHYSIGLHDMLSARRTKDLIVPRHIAMYLCKQLTLRSLPYIGRRFGGRDHTTVLHAVRKIGEWIECRPEIAASVATIRNQIEGQGRTI